MSGFADRGPRQRVSATTWMHDPQCSRSWRWSAVPRIRVSVLAIAAALAAGCQSDVRATLVALRGCGLDGLELSELAIVPRGDFPTVEGAEANGGIARLPDLPDDVVAITVEGRFNDITEAVGRTARLDRDGDIPVYFAPIEELCVVQSTLDARELGAIAVGPEGDILLVGGRDSSGRLLDDIAYTRDDAEVVAPLPRGLPSATSGLVVVPFGDRRFAAIGGARSDSRVLDQLVEIDLDLADPVADPWAIHVDGLDSVARAFHAAAVLPNGHVLVTGGCRTLDDDSRCDPETGSILKSTFAIDPRIDDDGVPTFDRGPDHVVARYDHELLVARDGVVFAAGGRTVDGRGIVTIERLRPGVFEWERYGPTQDLNLEMGEAIIGAALLEGGLLVVVTNTGGIGWVSELAADRWWQPGEETFTWCDAKTTTVGCFHDESEPTPALTRRRLLALPDERVLADTWLLPIGHVGQGLEQALDVSEPRPDQAGDPLPARVSAEVLQLGDGTVLLAGGRDTTTLDLITPFLLRFRPDLEGPDERIPNIAELRPGSFVAHDPPEYQAMNVNEPEPMLKEEGVERVSIEGATLRLRSNATEQEIPDAWAHVRSFRSASFRFEVTLQTTGDAQAHLVLSYGAVARTSIRLGARIEGVQVGSSGLNPSTYTCSVSGVNLTEPKRMRFDVTPEKVVIEASGIEIASCPGSGDAPAALGLGVSDSGDLLASGMRLTRI